MSENTKKGLYEAKQKGVTSGRPKKPGENVKRAIVMYQSKKYTLEEIKQETGISKSTLYRYLEN
ncbi:helix-turn-helix domain-containing protein [Gottfriedia sp. NPDC056225]|uniref:helix-turn-helix domain-containing protein n=1 Tax=Gottfriedia sp. NPDC056225 TaxID=3345751 RepID=UPI0035D94A0D